LCCGVGIIERSGSGRGLFVCVCVVAVVYYVADACMRVCVVVVVDHVSQG